MKLVLIGVGQAGGKIVDEFVEYEDRTGEDFVASAAAINTARADLAGLERVPPDRRVLVGQSRVKGHGVGADNELGAEIARDDRDEILGVMDAAPAGAFDAFLVVGALGGGTGSGAAPVIARQLRRIYTEPVYGLGVLPGRNEGGIYTLNAARSFKTFAREVDNLLVFDNEPWRRSGESIRSSYDRINGEIVRRFGTLFTAGEVSAGDAVGEHVVDASEIINTLGTSGVSTVGYATTDVDRTGRGLLSRFARDEHSRDERSFEEAGTDARRVASLVRKATLGRLTLPANVESAERGLVVVAGPRDYLSRKGIERGRNWLEEETGSMEIRGGDYPIGVDAVAAVVLLSGVSEVPRVRELQEVAIETRDRRAAIDERHEERLDELLEDDRDELDPLF